MVLASSLASLLLADRSIVQPQIGGPPISTSDSESSFFVCSPKNDPHTRSELERAGRDHEAGSYDASSTCE